MTIGQPDASNAAHRPTDDAEEVYFEGSPRLRAELSSVLAWGLAGVALLAIVAANLVRFHVHVPAWAYSGLMNIPVSERVSAGRLWY